MVLTLCGIIPLSSDQHRLPILGQIQTFKLFNLPDKLTLRFTLPSQDFSIPFRLIVAEFVLKLCELNPLSSDQPRPLYPALSSTFGPNQAFEALEQVITTLIPCTDHRLHYLI